MICWTLNIIFCMQHNTLKIKPLHVFNNTFCPTLLAIILINFFFFDRSLSFLSIFFRYAAVSRLSFHYWINTGWSTSFVYVWIYFQRYIKMHIIYHFSTLMQKLWLQTRTYGDSFRGISSRRDCAVARHYEIIFI